jgi:hypothetical protein
LKIGLITPTEHGILIVRPNRSKVFYKLDSSELPTSWLLNFQYPKRGLGVNGEITYTHIYARSGYRLVLSKVSGSRQIYISVKV